MNQIQKNTALIETRLEALLPKGSILEEAMRYSVLSPGKRIRPLLMLAIADYLETEIDDVLDVACAIEMIHAASLIIDDLPCMDDDAIRRNQSTTHKKYGEPVAILSSISLLTRSYDLVAQFKTLPAETRFDIIHLFSDTIGPKGLSLGQQTDLKLQETRASAEEISSIHHLKTGVLFLAAARAACLVAGANELQAKKIMEYTFNLGMAFQALDDIKDSERQETNMVLSLGRRKTDLQLNAHLDKAMAVLMDAKQQPILVDFINFFFQSDNALQVQSA